MSLLILKELESLNMLEIFGYFNDLIQTTEIT